MAQDVVYGKCKHCGKKLFTYVTARAALIASKCPDCGRYFGKESVTADVKVALKL